MASKTTTVTEYVDDLDGSKAEGTVAFSVEGTNYEIDLSKKNSAAMLKALKPYIDHARKVRGTRSKAGSTSKASGRRKDLGAVREWAKANGYEVSDRGRIPAQVVEAYDAK